MAVKSTMREIAERINKTIDKLSDSEIEAMITKIKVKGKNNKIFVMGVGRSGLVARMFTMRLVHLGLTAYVIGEIVTPAMTKNDLLITVSGSGGTKSVVSAAKTAGEIGTEVLSITSHPESELGKISNIIVNLKVKRGAKIDTKKDYFTNQIKGRHISQQYSEEELIPLGTLFEDTAMIFFDGVIARLMVELKQRNEDLKGRHATLEWFA
ncbi:6-phospho 3-hexuloisomerase [Candidatus Altiarchaeales archaeon WOR_SM1_SCG]|nr:6-phospho 3-hexuloisomerase [Candidatus Altiarchaeales archaeon WOR_SM1_SCG]